MAGLPSPSTSPSRGFRSSYRRRRIMWSLILLTCFGLFFLAPTSFWETSRSHASALADSGRAWLPTKLGGVQPYSAADELRDFLHMVASSELTIPPSANVAEPLEPEVYSVNLGDVAWLQQVEMDPPVIVFSKTFCPYSKKAKALLQSYDLKPKPRVIEVDLRSDGDQIKALLTRLTKHSTFPNIFVGGKSLGGYDDLKELDGKGELVTLLSNAGVITNVEG